jgi:hypothetical protein
MDDIREVARQRAGECGFSVVMAEKALMAARGLKLVEEWDRLQWGNVSRRSTAYRPRERIMAVVAGLACGLRGVAEGNNVLRTNSAIREALGGRFPDQGTIHRWLEQTTQSQAAALRSHLHRAVAAQGRFWNVLRRGERLIVDVDAQGLVARGERHQQAAWGKLGGVIDRGYQRFVAYAAQTREALDEFLRPGATALTGELPELLAGLNEIFSQEDRPRVVIRADAHGGTFQNLKALQKQGYSYLCRMMSWSAVKRLKEARDSLPGQTFETADSQGAVHQVECWDAPRWEMSGRNRRDGVVTTRAVLFQEPGSRPDKPFVFALLTSLDLTPEELWTLYHQRGGTIEEYNDQSERAFHLAVIRCGSYHGLNALHALVGLCWNLTEWVLEDLQLPDPAPQSDRSQWTPAPRLDRSRLLQRAALCGLRLIRRPGSSQLEVADTFRTIESGAWLRWLGKLIQPHLALAA